MLLYIPKLTCTMVMLMNTSIRGNDKKRSEACGFCKNAHEEMMTLMMN